MFKVHVNAQDFKVQNGPNLPTVTFNCLMKLNLNSKERFISSFTHPGQRNAVNRTLVFHFSPPKAGMRERERDQFTSHLNKDTKKH